MEKDGWRLDRMTVNYCDYGDNKGKHTGTIEFRNDNRDSFLFQLDAEKVSQYMDLIRGDVSETAENLGKLLASSIN